ncbi:MAG TPA: hypothetical protein VH933_07700 [Aestuariivirgaceae bacterium]|jgi:hypothetical protein
MKRRLMFQTSILIGLTVVLLVSALALLLRPVDVAGIHAKYPSFSANVNKPQDMHRRSSGQAEAILARPLFSKTRRPYHPAEVTAQESVEVATVPAEPQASVPTEALSLKGIVLRLGIISRAFIVSPSAPAGAWFEEGGEIEGWRIGHIGQRTISLQQGNKVVELSLYPNTSLE